MFADDVVSVRARNDLQSYDAYTHAVRDEIGTTIKRLREAKDWSLDDLASVTGVDRGTLSRIELGKNKPHRSTLRSIVRGLRPQPADLHGHPRLLEAFDDATDHGGARGGVGIEDRLADLLDYVKTLKGKTRSDFIRAGIALLTALEHARPAEATGTTENDER